MTFMPDRFRPGDRRTTSSFTVRRVCGLVGWCAVFAAVLGWASPAHSDPADDRARDLRQIQSTAYIIFPALNDVEAIGSLGAQLVILQNDYTQEQVARMKAGGVKLILANVDASELITGLNPGLLGQDFVGNPVPGYPGLYSARYWLPSWLELVIRPNIQKALQAGFDGIYFDAATGFEWSPGNPEGNPLNPNRVADMANLLITAADFVHELNPRAVVLANNVHMDGLLQRYPAVGAHLDGAVAEANWWRQDPIDPTRPSPAPTPQGAERLAVFWQMFQAAGKRVFFIDYVPRGETAQQLAYAEFALRHSYVPELTDALQKAEALENHPYFAYSYEPNSTVTGRAGRLNFLYAAGPSATVVGASGAINYALFTRPSGSYISAMSGDQIIVTGGPEGQSTLINIQYMHFSDGVTIPTGPMLPFLMISVNERTFAPGETLRASVAVSNPGRPESADVYMGLLQPDGSIQFFTNDGIVLGTLADVRSFRAIATGVSLGTPFSVMLPDFYIYSWAGNEPRGDYTLFLVVVTAGALDDSQLLGSEILGLTTIPFLVLESRDAGLRNGSFESPFSNDWLFFVATNQGAAASLQRTSSNTLDGSYLASVSVTAAASFTSVQLWQGGLLLTKDASYTLRFWARSSTPRNMHVNVLKDGGDFHDYGLATTAALETDWREYVFNFRALETVADGRLNFYFGEQGGDTWIDSIQITFAGL
jgi:hypothetical protein